MRGTGSSGRSTEGPGGRRSAGVVGRSSFFVRRLPRAAAAGWVPLRCVPPPRAWRPEGSRGLAQVGGPGQELGPFRASNSLALPVGLRPTGTRRPARARGAARRLRGTHPAAAAWDRECRAQRSVGERGFVVEHACGGRGGCSSTSVRREGGCSRTSLCGSVWVPPHLCAAGGSSQGTPVFSERVFAGHDSCSGAGLGRPRWRSSDSASTHHDVRQASAFVWHDVCSAPVRRAVAPRLGRTGSPHRRRAPTCA
jgi:hypothetical protein